MILITGAAGYIGNVLRSMLPVGTYIGIDSFIKGNKYSKFNEEVLYIDIRDYEYIKYLLMNYPITEIVNLSAIVGDPACKKYKEAAHFSNVFGLDILTDLVRDIKNIQPNRKLTFIQASTCSVYGFNEELVNEESELNPLSLYAEQKVEAEQIIQDKLSDYRILRFATAFGWSPAIRFDLTVNEFTRDIYFENTLEIYRESDWRPYCHVRDISRFIMIMTSHQIESGIYNVGFDFNNSTKNNIIDIIVSVMATDLDRIIVYNDQAGNPPIKFIKDETETDPRNYKVSFDKIYKYINHVWSLKNTCIHSTIKAGVKEIIENIISGAVSDAYNIEYRSDYLNM